MADDPVGLATVFDRVDELADDPRPATALPWGNSDFLRLRIGRYRILYEIADRTIRISVIHLGRRG
jgi:mRNA interferase RelE/StbE